MTLATALLLGGLAAAAMVGAGLRHLVSESFNGQLPYGTLLVNIVASFLLASLSQLDVPWDSIVGLGAIGALSTWSTVANEVAQLARAGEGGAAVLYLAATLTTGILAAWLGLQMMIAF